MTLDKVKATYQSTDLNDNKDKKKKSDDDDLLEDRESDSDFVEDENEKVEQK